jgi:hypothetical protein
MLYKKSNSLKQKSRGAPINHSFFSLKLRQSKTWQ